MNKKSIFLVVSLSFTICLFFHRVEAKIEKENFKQIDLSYIDLVLMDVEKDVERDTIRKALFLGKENVNFILDEIRLINEHGYIFQGFSKDNACKIQVDFWILNYQQFKEKPKKEQRERMMNKVKEIEAKLIGIVGFDKNGDLKVRFIASQFEGNKDLKNRQDFDILGDKLVAKYNEGELIFVNRTLRDIIKQERKLKKVR